MADADHESNRLYSDAADLHPLHWERLGRRPPEEAARAAGARWDGEAFHLPLLGRGIRVAPGSREVSWSHPAPRRIGYQRALAAVAYLAGAIDAPARGDFVTFRELPGGDAFFRGPHAVATGRLEAAFGHRPEALWVAAAALGGRPAAGTPAGGADLTALPRIPLRLLLWPATSEFGARAALLVDPRAHLHLALDVLWALSNVAVSDLVEASP